MFTIFSNSVKIEFGIIWNSFNNTWVTITLPSAYSSYNSYSVSVQGSAKSTSHNYAISMGYNTSSTRIKTNAKFTFGTDGTYAGANWITVGY